MGIRGHASTECVNVRRRSNISDIRNDVGRAATPQISCRHFIYNAAGHYANRTQWHCVRRASSHPTDTHAPLVHAGKNNPKRRSCMPHRRFETPVLCARCQRSEHRPVKISTFRPLLIRRPLRRPSPLIAMRSDFDE